MKRPVESSHPSFPVPQDQSKLSSVQPSKEAFNKKRFWTVIVIIAVIEVLVIALVQQWKYIFPINEVSPLYEHYAAIAGIDATFIKDFRVNDSVFIDVTLLEAKDSANWAMLKRDFAVPELDSKICQHIYNKKELIFSQPLTLSHYPINIPSDTIIFDELAISYYSHTLTIFHAKNEKEILELCIHNLNESIN